MNNTDKQYRRGYDMGSNGVRIEPQDHAGAEFVRGHEDGYSDFWEQVYGDDADMEGIGMVTI